MRLLRAVGARSGSWALLAAVVAAVVTAGVVSSGASAGAARTGAFLPLLLLTLVAVPVPATELARRRRAELALVRLRGVLGARLVASAIAEPVAAVVVGALAGLVAGMVALRLLHQAWDVPALVGADEVAHAAGLALVAALVAVGSTVVVAREPLPVAVRRRAWSGPGARGEFAGLVTGVAVLVAALLAVYRSRSDSPGSLVLAGTALVGIAVGQLLVWLQRGLGRRSGLFASSSIPLLLGVRRALGAEHAAPVRVLVATATVVASAACAVTAVEGWADDSARTRAGAPVQLELPDSAALETLLLTRRLDPDGRWLMAAAVNDERDEARLRVAWLDLARYERVSGAHLAPTPADVGDALDELAAAPGVQLVQGGAVTVTTAPRRRPVTVTFGYLSDAGVVTSLPVVVPPEGSASAPVADCTVACVALDLEASADVEVTGLQLGDTDLLVDQAWVREGLPGNAAPGPLVLAKDVVLRPASGQVAEPMLVAGALDLDEATPVVEGIGGSARPLLEVGQRPALPLVVGAGLLGDLPVALAAAGGSVPAVRSLVLARADTPDDVIAGLRDAGAEAPRGWGPADEELSDRELAEQRVTAVTGAAAVALALLVLLSGAGRRARTRRREQASLRLVGVPAGAQRRAGLVEASVLAVPVGLAAWLGSRLATATVVDGSELASPGVTGLPFGSTVSAGPLVVVAVVAAVLAVVGLVLAPLAQRRGAGAPALLLTEADESR